MALFSNNYSNNESDNSNKTYSEAVKLVNDKSVFGRYYSKICQILKMRNVPASRFPSREHFMSRIFCCIDENKLNEWLTKYAETEAINIEEENDET